MKPIWTPWRKDYVTGAREALDGCLFCRLAETAEDDSARLVLARSSYTFAALNRYPYTYGHTMVIPYEHVSSLEGLTPAALSDLMLMTNRTMRVLREIADPPAFNIGANIGAAAGASIAAHFHFHIVPRWDGDHNFMQCIGGTRTVPDTLDNIRRQMRSTWELHYGPNQDGQS